MSRYLIRHVEGRFECVKGSVNKKDDLPKDAAPGDTWKVWGVPSEQRYQTFNGVEWFGSSSCKSEWRLLTPMTYKARKPKPEYPGQSEDEFIDELQKQDGSPIWLKRHEEFCNNGGAMRDDYVGNGWGGNECFWRDRGFPEDMSEETKKACTYDGELRGYSKTWCTGSELYSLYETEEKRILSLIKDAYMKSTTSSMEKKIDFIIKNMKEPARADLSEIYKKKSEDEDDDEYYDSPEYLIEEYMPNLFLLAEELGKVNYIGDLYGIYSGEDLRIIYYIE